EAVDFLVHDEDGQALARRLFLTEGTEAHGIAAVDERAAPSHGHGLDTDVPPGVDGGTAPGAVGDLGRGAADAEAAGFRRSAADELDGFVGLVGRVRSRALPNPQADAERG